MKTRKPLSILLTLCLIVGLIPWTVLPARADGEVKVAKVGNTEYTVFNDADGDNTNDAVHAWLAAGSGAALTLLADVTTANTIAVTCGTAEQPMVLDLNGHVIKGSSSARVFSVSGSLTLTDSRPTFTGTESEPRAEVTYKDFYSHSFTVTGGCITGGKGSSGNGGGVSVESGGAFTMNGGTISGCKATEKGGGVYVSGSFTMNGGAVSGNTVEDKDTGSGGGVYVGSGGTFVMNGGVISGNSVCIFSYGLTGRGGGVSVESSGAFTMNGGEISGNAAGTAGGGVFNSSMFTMTGGVITRNVSMYSNNDGNGGGGGVYVNSTLFTVSGSPVICGNLNSGQPNNVFLKGTTIKGAGGLESGACIGVTTFNGTGITADWKISSLVDASRFFSDDFNNYIVGINGGEPGLYSGKWSDSFPEAEGLSYVRLSNAYDSPITVCSGQYVTLNLNGVTVSGGITVEDGGSLTIIDGTSGSNGKISGSGVTVKGTLVLCGGKITGCSDGGVTVDGGTFVMEGGSITGNTAAEHGGGVYVKSGTFKVSGSAAITGNVIGGTITDGVLSGGTAGNVCLAAGGKITVAGALTGTFGVSMQAPGVFTSDLAKGGVNAISRFTGDATGSFLLLDDNNEAVLGVPSFSDDGKVTAPAGATLVCATYKNGQMTAVQTVTLDANCIGASAATLLGKESLPAGCKLFLLAKGTYAPLCEAWSN